MGLDMLQCYNRTCGQKYDPDDNNQKSCTYHPGAPFFHDAYKGWSCCKKKTVDFTDFLNIKGCTQGFHSNVKPVEPVKISGDKSEVPCDITARAPALCRAPCVVAVPTARPDFDAPMTQLKCVVTDSLSRALQQRQKEVENARSCCNVAGSSEPAVGTTCTRSGCTSRKGDGESSECRYHSGAPVFHEGMKYWSCCQRKTSDFNTFLSQQGCCTGQHQWTKPTEDTERHERKTASVRHDWHQTGSHVYVAIYTRFTDPHLSSVMLAPVRLRVHIVYDGGRVFDQDIELCQSVEPGECSVQLLASKVEIKLKKSGAASWKQLHVRQVESDHVPASSPAPAACDHVTSVSDRVDAVDLSDL